MCKKFLSTMNFLHFLRPFRNLCEILGYSFRPLLTWGKNLLFITFLTSISVMYFNYFYFWSKKSQLLYPRHTHLVCTCVGFREAITFDPPGRGRGRGSGRAMNHESCKSSTRQLSCSQQQPAAAATAASRHSQQPVSYL
jgi:hypothetical protein